MSDDGLASVSMAETPGHVSYLLLLVHGASMCVPATFPRGP